MKSPVSALIFGERADIERAMDDIRLGIVEHPLVRVIDSYGNASRYRFRLDNVKLVAILEVERHDDAELWAHLSVSASAPQRLPTWKELRWAKEHFLGDRRAIMVLPPRDEYVNITFNVLNLYACLSSNPLPDFRYKDPITDQVGI